MSDLFNQLNEVIGEGLLDSMKIKTKDILINGFHDNQDSDYISECIQAELIDRGYSTESFSWAISVTIFEEGEDEN